MTSLFDHQALAGSRRVRVARRQQPTGSRIPRRLPDPGAAVVAIIIAPLLINEPRDGRLSAQGARDRRAVRGALGPRVSRVARARLGRRSVARADLALLALKADHRGSLMSSGAVVMATMAPGSGACAGSSTVGCSRRATGTRRLPASAWWSTARSCAAPPRRPRRPQRTEHSTYAAAEREADESHTRQRAELSTAHPRRASPRRMVRVVPPERDDEASAALTKLAR